MTGIILAGGKSTRMGSEKGLAVFGGKPLIHYALDVMIPLCDEILISSNSESYHNLEYEVIPDEYPGIGPMGGIYSCLNRSKNEINLVLSCDMPFVTVELFRCLLLKRGNSMICVPWYVKDHFEPLCGIYHKDVVKDMHMFILKKNYKLPDLFMQVAFMPVNVNELCPDRDRDCFININSPEDLRKYNF